MDRDDRQGNRQRGKGGRSGRRGTHDRRGPAPSGRSRRSCHGGRRRRAARDRHAFGRRREARRLGRDRAHRRGGRRRHEDVARQSLRPGAGERDRGDLELPRERPSGSVSARNRDRAGLQVRSHGERRAGLHHGEAGGGLLAASVRGRARGRKGERWMIRRIVALTGVVITAIVLQSTVFGQIKLFGTKPELLYIVTVLLAIIEGPQEGMLFGFFGGMAQDFFLNQPKGVTALTLTLLGYTMGLAASTSCRRRRSCRRCSSAWAPS